MLKLGARPPQHPLKHLRGRVTSSTTPRPPPICARVTRAGAVRTRARALAGRRAHLEFDRGMLVGKTLRHLPKFVAVCHRGAPRRKRHATIATEAHACEWRDACVGAARYGAQDRPAILCAMASQMPQHGQPWRERPHGERGPSRGSYQSVAATTSDAVHACAKLCWRRRAGSAMPPWQRAAKQYWGKGTLVVVPRNHRDPPKITRVTQLIFCK